MTDDREIRDLLRSLPELEAPAAVVEDVLREVRAEDAARARWKSAWLRPLPAALAAAAVLLLAVALAFLVRDPVEPELQLALDDPAVVQATFEVKLALAHVGRAQRQIADLQGDLLRERLLGPTARSVSRRLVGETPAGEIAVDHDPSGGRG